MTRNHDLPVSMVHTAAMAHWDCAHVDCDRHIVQTGDYAAFTTSIANHLVTHRQEKK